MAGEEDLNIGGDTFEVTLPDGTTVSDYHKIGSHTLFGGVRNAIQNGCLGTGSDDDSVALNTLANTTMQPYGGVIFFASPGTYLISNNITLPANVSLWFVNGASLSIDNGVTVIINGTISAGFFQIFGGQGTANFTGPTVVRPVQWWGAVDDYDGSSGTDNTGPINKAIACSYNRHVYLPYINTGGYLCTGAVTIDPTTYRPIEIYGDGGDASGGALNYSVSLWFTGSGNGLEIINASPGQSTVQTIIIRDLGIRGDGLNVAGGQMIYALNVNNLCLQRLWVSDSRENGVYFEGCYSSRMSDVTMNRNRRSGFYSKGQFNNGDLIRIRAFSNGRIYSASALAGVFINDLTGISDSINIESMDAEGNGLSAFQLFKRSDGTLTNIVVLTNVGTATTSIAHGLSAGDTFIIRGATVDTDFNRVGAYAVLTTPTAFTFTFATVAVSNGTYSESTLFIGPWVPGIVLAGCEGVVIKNYNFEGGGVPLSNSIYTGATTVGLTMIGGHQQDGWMLIDLSIGGSIRGVVFTGSNSGAKIGASATISDQIDFSSDNVFISSAFLVRPGCYKEDGVFHATTVPTTGTFKVNQRVYQTNPTAATPDGWVCSAAPHTFVTLANVT